MDVPSLLAAVTESADALAIVPNPAPIDPTGGSTGPSFLISVAKWGSLIICGIVGVISGGVISFGGLSKRPDVADLGKKALFCSFIGIVVSGTWIIVTNTTWSFFS